MCRSITSLVLLLITIPIGLAVRFLPLHLPWFLYKYLGSTLWAVALYWFLAALLPKLRPLAIATIAITIATLVELSRLIPIAPIDAFRLTLAGHNPPRPLLLPQKHRRLHPRHHPHRHSRPRPLSRKSLSTLVLSEQTFPCKFPKKIDVTLRNLSTNNSQLPDKTGVIAFVHFFLSSA